VGGDLLTEWHKRQLITEKPTLDQQQCHLRLIYIWMEDSVHETCSEGMESLPIM
jgi:hypothetical protein